MIKSGDVMIPISKLEDTLTNLPREYITMFLVNSRDYFSINLRILEHLCNTKKLPGIYITVNRPYETIVKILENNEISTDNLFFVDCITTIAGCKTKRSDKCLYVSPNFLTDLAIATDQWVQAIPGTEKFLFLDSISTLLLYNSAGTVAKFSHFLTGRMRLWNLTGVFMSLEKENDPNILERISQFCDEVITIKSEDE